MDASAGKLFAVLDANGAGRCQDGVSRAFKVVNGSAPLWYLTHNPLASRDEVGIWSIPVWFGGAWAKRRQ